MWQVARRLGWRGLREALRRPVMPPREGGWALPLEPGDDGPPLLVVRELPAEQLQQVRAYARAQPATVYAVLLAAWYRAVARPALARATAPRHGRWAAARRCSTTSGGSTQRR